MSSDLPDTYPSISPRCQLMPSMECVFVCRAAYGINCLLSVSIKGQSRLYIKPPSKLLTVLQDTRHPCNSIVNAERRCLLLKNSIYANGGVFPTRFAQIMKWTPTALWNWWYWWCMDGVIMDNSYRWINRVLLRWHSIWYLITMFCVSRRRTRTHHYRIDFHGK